jgi:sulfur carrier protein
MRIKVNATEKTVHAATLAALCQELGYQSQLVATAINGEFVSRDKRANTSIQEGDAVEIVAPMQGG